MQNKPILHNLVGDSYLNRIDMSACTNYLFVADQLGTITQYDIRKKLQPIKSYKGVGGSIRDLQCHPIKPIFGACGLNRYFK